MHQRQPFNGLPGPHPLAKGQRPLPLQRLALLIGFRADQVLQAMQ